MTLSFWNFILDFAFFMLGFALSIANFIEMDKIYSSGMVINSGRKEHDNLKCNSFKKILW